MVKRNIKLFLTSAVVERRFVAHIPFLLGANVLVTVHCY